MQCNEDMSDRIIVFDKLRNLNVDVFESSLCSSELYADHINQSIFGHVHQCIKSMYGRRGVWYIFCMLQWPLPDPICLNNKICLS